METRDIGNYIVYPDGRVWSKWKKAFMKPSLGAKGYIATKIDGRYKRIHRLVAEAFLPNPLNLPEVDHINNNKLDNHVQNLQWITVQNNQLKSFKQGRIPTRGTKHGMSKLKELEIYAIKYNHPELNNTEVSKIYKCTASTIGQIRSGKIWKHI